MILGSKHVGAILSALNVKFYVSALVGVIIKVILRNVRCSNKDIISSSLCGGVLTVLVHNSYCSGIANQIQAMTGRVPEG